MQEIKKAGGLSGDALLALPAPGDAENGSADKEQKEGDEEEETASARGKKGIKSKAAAKGKAKKTGKEGGEIEPAAAAPTRSSQRRGGAAANAEVVEDPEEEDAGGAGAGPSTNPADKIEKLTAAVIEAAEKEVESFNAAIAEAEALDANKAKRRNTMSTSAAVAAATAAAVREAAQDAGAEAEDAEAAAGAMIPSSATANGSRPNLSIATPAAVGAAAGPLITTAPADEEQEEEDDDGNLSEISDGDIAMYLADEAEVACKEEIWNLMNQDWVEKQAAKRAAIEAAERAQEEQRAAMEAAAAAGIQYKRGRGRPLGSKTKPKQETNLPPAETPQEAAMRMLDTKKLSSKINYTALADLFSDEPAGAGGRDSDEDDEEEEDFEEGDGAGPSGTSNRGTSDGSDPSTSKAAAEGGEGGRKTGAQPPASGASGSGKRSLEKDDDTRFTSGNGFKRPSSASRIAGMAPRAAGRLAGLSAVPAAVGAGGRLGGLNSESLTGRPLGSQLGTPSLGLGNTGSGSVPIAKKSNTKVRFKPGTKKD